MAGTVVAATLAAMLVAMLMAGFEFARSGHADTNPLLATQDTRVLEQYPNRKVGTDPALHAKAGAGTRLESYLRFEVSGVAGTVTSAKLKLYATESTADAAEVTPTTGGSTWAEGQTSWSNRPQPTGGDLGPDVGKVAAGTTVAYDVTSVVDGDGEYNFRLASVSTDRTGFESRENPGGHAPVLEVSTDTVAEPDPDPVMVGAGDIADCGEAITDDTATGDLVDAQVAAKPDTYVYTLGDNAYESGKLSEFNDCYDPTWGASGGDFLGRTHPAIGNHEYADAYTSSAGGYFDYFEGRAAMTGNRGEGYYAYDVGPNWRAIVLNSNPKTARDLSPGCGADASGTAQKAFLKRELANAGTKNVLSYFHHARFSDGQHGSTEQCAKKFFDLLYQAKADLVLAGHNHIYERLTDIDAQGNPVADGIDQFVVGQGGHEHDSFAVLDAGKSPPPAGSVDARDNTRSGVLKLTLGADGYDWEYLGVPGESTFADSGSEPVFR